MKFPDYDSAPDAEPDFRDRFRRLSGDLYSESLLNLVSFLAGNIATAAVDRRPIIGIAGAQGTGKTTVSRFLSTMLEDCLGRSVATLSLDDFYLPREERAALAGQVHPLLAVRGVPGTHDAELMESAVGLLREGRSTKVPVFSKAEDTRTGSREIGPADIVLCEGWCWGAAPQSSMQLASPVNELEQVDDSDGVWRKYVNNRLADYQSLFTSDALIFFRAPSMDAVIRWRIQQEQELLQSGGGSRVMDEQEVRQFVSYYERITRWMLEEVPMRSNVTVRLSETHAISSVTAR